MPSLTMQSTKNLLASKLGLSDVNHKAKFSAISRLSAKSGIFLMTSLSEAAFSFVTCLTSLLYNKHRWHVVKGYNDDLITLDVRRVYVLGSHLISPYR